MEYKALSLFYFLYFFKILKSWKNKAMPSLISVCFIMPQMSPEAGETAIGVLQAGVSYASLARHYEVNPCSDYKEGISKPARQMAIQDLVVLG